MIMICRCWGKKTIDYQNPKKDKVTSDPSSPSGLNGRNLGSDSSKRQTDVQRVFRKSEMKSLESQCHSRRYGADRHEHDHDLIPSPPIDSQYLPSSTQGQFSTHTHRVLASETTGFSFPILIPSSSARNPIPVEEPPRDSLEMYLPSDLLCINSGKSADTIPTPRIFAPNPAAHDRRRSFTLSASPNSRKGAAGEDDVAASDVSSDLFEIEIFTTQSKTHTKANIATNNPMCHRCDFPDESSATPSFAPTECYDCEPSEASVRWSVTTAEGFDRGNIPNFSVSASYKVNDDVTLMRRALQRLGNGGFDDDDDDDSGESGRRRENGIMVTCRCGLGQ